MNRGTILIGFAIFAQGCTLLEPSREDLSKSVQPGCSHAIRFQNWASAVRTSPGKDTAPETGPFHVLNGDWTLELWINFSRPFRIFGMNAEDIKGHAIALILEKFAPAQNYELSCAPWGDTTTNAPGTNIVKAYNLTAGAWHHVACQRRGGLLSLHVDGEFASSAPTDVEIRQTSGAYWGHPPTVATAEPGNELLLLGPIRFSGVARYNETSFVPRTRWTKDEDTRLLLLMDKGLSGKSFTDEAGFGANTYVVGGVVAEEVDTPCSP